MGSQQSDTVPPPPGEEDAYSAETKVAPAPAELLKQIRAKQNPAPKPAETTETELTPAIPNIAQLAKELSEDPENLQTVAILVKPPASAKEPPLGGESYDADSSEPTLDKNIRFFLKEHAQKTAAERPPRERPSSDPGSPTGLSARDRPTQLLLAALVAFLMVCLIVWRFG